MILRTKHEYHEGPKALEKFNKGMSKLFEISKDAAEKPKPKPKRKKSSKD